MNKLHREAEDLKAQLQRLAKAVSHELIEFLLDRLKTIPFIE